MKKKLIFALAILVAASMFIGGSSLLCTNSFAAGGKTSSSTSSGGGGSKSAGGGVCTPSGGVCTPSGGTGKTSGGGTGKTSGGGAGSTPTSNTGNIGGFGGGNPFGHDGVGTTGTTAPKSPTPPPASKPSPGKETSGKETPGGVCTPSGGVCTPSGGTGKTSGGGTGSKTTGGGTGGPQSQSPGGTTGGNNIGNLSIFGNNDRSTGNAYNTPIKGKIEEKTVCSREGDCVTERKIELEYKDGSRIKGNVVCGPENNHGRPIWVGEITIQTRLPDNISVSETQPVTFERPTPQNISIQQPSLSQASRVQNTQPTPTRMESHGYGRLNDTRSPLSISDMGIFRGPGGGEDSKTPGGVVINQPLIRPIPPDQNRDLLADPVVRKNLHDYAFNQDDFLNPNRRGADMPDWTDDLSSLLEQTIGDVHKREINAILAGLDAGSEYMKRRSQRKSLRIHGALSDTDVAIRDARYKRDLSRKQGNSGKLKKSKGPGLLKKRNTLARNLAKQKRQTKVFRSLGRMARGINVGLQLKEASEAWREGDNSRAIARTLDIGLGGSAETYLDVCRTYDELKRVDKNAEETFSTVDKICKPYEAVSNFLDAAAEEARNRENAYIIKRMQGESPENAGRLSGFPSRTLRGSGTGSADLSAYPYIEDYRIPAWK